MHGCSIMWGLNWCPGPGYACTLFTKWGDPTVSCDSKSVTMGDVYDTNGIPMVQCATVLLLVKKSYQWELVGKMSI